MSSKYITIPEGADSISTRYLEGLRERLPHMTITQEELDWITRKTMEAQKPRDEERLRKKVEKEQEKELRRQLKEEAKRAALDRRFMSRPPTA